VLTFLGGPRVSPRNMLPLNINLTELHAGVSWQRFAIVEMKILYYILLTNFVFRETEEKIVKQNV
jgi:hypothetical protein